MAGAFITVEGIEGVGKSTSLVLVERSLAACGREVLVTREPGGTELGECIREWLLNGEHAGLAPEVEALLMFAARAHHLRSVIEPALARGQWVVCDRFTDATFAYQGGGRGCSMEWLEGLADAVQRGLEPDLTLLLDAPVEVGFARIADRKPDHFEREQKAFFERVRSAYLSLAEREPKRILLIDAARPRELVDRDIEQAVRRFCERFSRDGR
ncbi:MAG TPA: dTMP kinase [Gammaproteobacteria bacterium]|nr:dTMP kinase [Gammaproteobacteria bacterium]